MMMINREIFEYMMIPLFLLKYILDPALMAAMAMDSVRRVDASKYLPCVIF